MFRFGTMHFYAFCHGGVRGWGLYNQGCHRLKCVLRCVTKNTQMSLEINNYRYTPPTHTHTHTHKMEDNIKVFYALSPWSTIKVAILPLSLGVTLFLMICCIKHWYQIMDLGLPFHSRTFDDIMMTSSGFRENPIFFDNFVFEKMDPVIHLSNSNFASSISMKKSKKIVLAFEDYCFCFPVVGLFVKSRAPFINIWNKNSLFWQKKPVT